MKLQLGKHEIEIGSLMGTNKTGFLTNHFTDEEKIREMQLFEELTKNKKTLVDIGSSYGAFSLVFTDKEDKVAHAIDGSFNSQLSLKQTCILNPQRKIHIHRLMIGGKSGITKCVFDEHQSLIVGESNGEVFSVEPMMTLDDFCEIYNVVPDVINIDVEGAEVGVLDGAEKTITNYRPLIFIEIHKNFVKRFHGKSTMDIYNWFLKLQDYKAFDMNMKELVPTRYCIYLDNIERESVENVWIPQ